MQPLPWIHNVLDGDTRAGLAGTDGPEGDFSEEGICLQFSTEPFSMCPSPTTN